MGRHCSTARSQGLPVYEVAMAWDMVLLVDAVAAAVVAVVGAVDS